MTDNRNWRDQNSRNYSNRPHHQNDHRGGQGNGGRNDRHNNPNHPSNGQGFNRGNGNNNRPAGNNQNQESGVEDSLKLDGTNLGYLFNRLLYTDNFGLLEHQGDEEENQLIKNRLAYMCKSSRMQIERAQALLEPPEGMGVEVIELETQYPGLCVGLGYAHGLPGKDDVKNGFFFDHTTGLPIIPASSVKGTLRSAFEEMPEYTAILLQGTDFFADSDEKTVKSLLNELFEGLDEKNQPLPMNRRTVFFDAYPCGCSEQGFLGFDSITPHDEKGLKEPNPIKMLKIKGGVKFKFPFRFAEMNADRKQALAKVFAQLLMDWGIGAKTNVGYGTLTKR